MSILKGMLSVEFIKGIRANIPFPNGSKKLDEVTKNTKLVDVVKNLLQSHDSKNPADDWTQQFENQLTKQVIKKIHVSVSNPDESSMTGCGFDLNNTLQNVRAKLKLDDRKFSECEVEIRLEG